MVLGYAHNSFNKIDFILGLIMSFFLLICGIIISLVFKIIGIYITSAVIILLSLLCLILVFKEYHKSKRLKDEIIIFNEEKQTFIINKYGNDIIFNIDDIVKVEYKNRKLDFLEPILYLKKSEEGKIVFFLKNNKKIVTLEVKEVIHVYDLIIDVISRSKQN